MPDQINATHPLARPEADLSPSATVDPAGVEQRLSSLHSLHECKVILRGLQPTRKVAYVAPAGSVRPDRIDEWMAALRKELTDAKGHTVCDLVAVSRLPLTEDGQVDEEALRRLPVLDEGLTSLWEEQLKTLTGVQDAVVKSEDTVSQPAAG